MVKFRKGFLRVLTLILVALVAVTFTSMMARPVDAEEEATFSLTQGASIRNCTDSENPVYGMKFETTVSTSWLDAHRADKYNFGTLIFPAYVEGEDGKLTVDNYAKFNRGSDVATNKKNLDAIKFVVKSGEAVSEGFTMNSTITYTEQEVSNYLKTLRDSYTDEELAQEVKATLKRAYKREFTAISYAELYVEETDTWTFVYSDDSYTDSMEKVAMRLVNDATWGEVAKEYLPNGSETEVVNVDGYVVNGNGAVQVNDFEQDVHSVDFDATGLTSFVLGNKTLVQDNDYTINGTSLVLTESAINPVLGSYENLYAYDNDNNLTVIKILFAHKELLTAQDVKDAFDITGEYFNASFDTLIKGGTPESNYKAYVLGANIDMTGVKIGNIFKTTVDSVDAYFDRDGDSVLELETLTLANDLGFGGIFDGRGYSISNAVAGTDQGYFNYPNSSGTTSPKYNMPRNGFFGRLLKGAEVKNVAFINLNGTGTANANFAVTGPLAYASEGLLENVYIDINPACWVVRGPIANPGYNAEYKNVLINLPIENYNFVEHLATEKNNRYAYAYGSLFGGNGAAPVSEIGFDNVFVTSQIPLIAHKNGTTAYVDGIKDIYYGENDETILYDFNGEVTQSTVSEAIEDGSTRVGRISGVRRYDNNAQLVADVSNADKVKALTDTGLFKVVEGYLVWNTEKAHVTVSKAIDYDAYAKSLITSEFEDKDIEKIVVTAGGTEYELTNGAGYTKSYADGAYSYVFAQKASASDETVGMPYLDASKVTTQVFSLNVYTKDVIYTYDNVTYWTMIISNPEEFDSALDKTYTDTDRYNYGFYKLDADLDLSGLGFSYTGLTTTNQTFNFGFAGQFDGDGHTIQDIDNGKFSKGLFGNFTCASSVAPKIATKIQNLAVLNWTGNSAPVFGVWVNGQNVYLENIYVTYNKAAVPQGLIGNVYAGYAHLNNVYVDDGTNNNSSYETGAQWGDASGKGLRKTDFYAIDTMFNSLRWASQATDTSVTNFISVGKSALVNKVGNSNSYSKYFTNTVADGVYTHKLKNTGYGGTPISGEVYTGYAGNETQGNVLQLTGLNPAFVELASTSNGGTLAGHYCATCYGTFQAVSGSCSCGATLTSSTNLWLLDGAYTYAVTDLTGYTNPSNTSTTGEFVFHGANRYETVSAMKTAYAKDNTIFDSFLGATGNKMWKVTAEGQLVWHTTKLTYTNDEYIDYGADEGLLYTNELENVVNQIGGVDKVVEIVVNGNTLTIENGGILLDDNKEYIIGLNPLANGSTETNGVPFMNTRLYDSNKLTVTIYTEGDTYIFTNVNYQNIMIDTTAELKLALDMDYTETYAQNYGFYKLASDLKVSDTQNTSNPLGFAYTGFNASSYSSGFNKGFAGQFNGGGNTIDFNRNYMPYGLFGSFDIPWNQNAPLAQAMIYDLAITRYKCNAPVLAYYAQVDGYNAKTVINLNNLYIQMHAQDATKGLVHDMGRIITNNVLIDSTKTATDSYLTDAIYGEEVVGKGSFGSYGGTLFNKMRRYKEFHPSADNIKNLISIGRAPIAWQPAANGSSGWYSSVVSHVNNGGIYTHTVKGTGWSGITGEMYVGYAGNQTVGDVAMRKSLKDNFLALVTNNAGTSALPGAYCSTCYNQFVTDTMITVCPDEACGGEMKTVADLWSSPAVYNWGLTNLEGYDNSTCSASNMEVVFFGVDKYIDYAAMTAQYELVGDEMYASFLGVDGNKLWTVVDGVLTWVGATA